jgi:hypothetical protein
LVPCWTTVKSNVQIFITKFIHVYFSAEIMWVHYWVCWLACYSKVTSIEAKGAIDCACFVNQEVCLKDGYTNVIFLVNNVSWTFFPYSYHKTSHLYTSLFLLILPLYFLHFFPLSLIHISLLEDVYQTCICLHYAWQLNTFNISLYYFYLLPFLPVYVYSHYLLVNSKARL